ncbi:MAG: NAD-dependent epimerase/dehydratase family protein [Myxococcota bacterium]
MRILVTGGGGFLGSHIVRRLRSRGDEVRVFSRSRHPEVEALGAESALGDVAELGQVRAAMKGVESVFHVAARVGYWGDPKAYRRTNVEGTQNVIDACRAEGVGRLVFTSTPSVVIGEKGAPAGGDASLPYPDRYLSSYGPTKAEAERRVLAAEDLHTVALRPHFIFGPGDPQIAPRLVSRSRSGRLAQVGDGQNRVDVTFIYDCVDAHIRAHDALADDRPSCRGRAYFLGQAEPVRLWHFVARILEGFGAPPVKRKLSFNAAWRIGWALEQVYRFVPGGAEPPLTRMAAIMLGTEHWFDHTAATEDFGWKPLTPLDEALAQTFAAA